MRRLCVLVAAVVLLGGACRVDVVAEIDVEEDGSGVIRASVALDPDAAARVPELAEQLDVEDLRAAGWTVTGPEVEDDDRTVIRASKPFHSAADAGSVVAELSGPEGPLRDVVLERSRTTFSTTYDLRGRIDLAAGIEAFGDERLRAQLDGTTLGFAQDQLEAEIGMPVEDALGVRVVARLPGADEVVEAPRLGTTTDLLAQGEVTNGRRVTLSVVAAVAVAFLVLLGLPALIRRKH